MRSRATLFVVALSVLAAVPAFPAPDIQLLRDINDTIVPNGSHARDFLRVGNRMFFMTGLHEGNALWLSDGTTAGTRRFLAEPDHYHALLAALGERLVFTTRLADTSSTFRSTDGTSAGTQTLFQFASPGQNGDYVLLGDLADGRLLIWHTNPASLGGWSITATDGTTAGTSSFPVTFNARTGTYPSDMPAYRRDGYLYFGTYHAPTGAREVWRTNGTAAGTERIADDDPVPSAEDNLLGADEAFVYFSARNTGTSGDEVWRYRFATGDVELVADLTPGPADTRVIWLSPVPGGAALLTDNGTLWVAAHGGGIAPIATFHKYFARLGVVGPHTLFVAAGSAADGAELWSTDGTPGGTVRLRDHSPGTQDTSVNRGPDLAPGRTVVQFFGAGDPEVWSTDGTLAGTRRLSPGNTPITDTDPVFLPYTPNYPGDLWRIDRFTEAVRSLPNLGGSQYLAGFGRQAFFGGSDAVHGDEPWIADLDGARLLLDIEPQLANDSSYVDELTTVGDIALFRAYDPTHGFELWRTDGTAAGTSMVLDATPGEPNSIINRPVAAGGAVYYQSTNAVSQVLRRTDGTAAGTSEVHDTLPSAFQFDVPGSALGCDRWLTRLGDLTLFITRTDATGVQLWATDGTPAGTRAVNPAVHGGGFPVCELVTAGALAYYRVFDGIRDRLYRSDGTAAGTFQLTGLSAAQQDKAARDLTVVGTRLYFLLDDLDFPRLWSTDGTVAGTVPYTAGGEASGTPAHRIIGVLDGALILQRFQGNNQLGVARLDLATGNLAPLMFPVDFAMAGGVTTGHRLFFVCDGLCVTDGTAAGTSRLRAQSPGLPANPDLLAYHGSIYYVSRNETARYGLELWKSDGTSAGTMRLSPDSQNGLRDITRPAIAGGRVVFGMSDLPTGHELWVVTSAPPVATPDQVSMMAGESAIVNPLANDTDSDGRLVAEGLVISTVPGHGVASVQSDGSVRYTPNAGFTGNDIFRYRITDDTGNVSAETTVTVSVLPLPAPPGGEGGGGGGGRLELLLLALLGALAGRRARCNPAQS